MLDYLFFDLGIAQSFASRARELLTLVIIDTTPEGGVQVRVQDDALDDAQRERLETWYDEFFFGEQAKIVQEQDAGAESCGVQIRLNSGEFTTVLLDPQLLGKLLGVLDAEEVQALFSQVADAVENPRSVSVCHAMQCALIDLKDAV